MKNPRKMLVLVLAFWFLSSLSLQPVRGKMCSAMIKAAAGDNLTTLRDKAFAAFRTECRGKRGNLNDIKSCSFTLEASDQGVTFILQPLRAPFRLDFDVKTRNDATINLAEGNTEASVFASIVLAGWGNLVSAIRACFYTYSNGCSPMLFGGRSQYNEAGIVSGTERRPFWVEYKRGVVTVGKGGQEEAFLEWDAAAHHRRNISTPVYVGISSWDHEPAEWVFNQFCA